MHAQVLLALVASAAAAATQGFNYASTNADSSPRSQDDFEQQFKAAKALAGTNGAFNSARLYTMIAGGSQQDVIPAIPAAISTGTHLLLGMWASGDPAGFTNELAALKGAIEQYGAKLAPLVDGISIGSEDLYRITPTSQAHDPGLVGNGPDAIANYIGEVRKAIQGTALSGAKLGHVDTWTAWDNSSNSAVVDACDWIGMDAYPYFESEKGNTIENSVDLFDSAWKATQAAAKGKPVWVTETGWPTAGKTEGQGVPGVDAAQQFWEAVGCSQLFGKTNTWWFTYFDGAPNPTFGLVDSVGGQPKYDLSCSKKAKIGPSNSNQGVNAEASGTASASGTDSTSGPDSTGSSSTGTSTETGSSTESGTESSAPAETGSGGSGETSNGTGGSSSGTSATGTGSTNTVCFLSLIGTALLAITLF